MKNNIPGIRHQEGKSGIRDFHGSDVVFHSLYHNVALYQAFEIACLIKKGDCNGNYSRACSFTVHDIAYNRLLCFLCPDKMLLLRHVGPFAVIIDNTVP